MNQEIGAIIRVLEALARRQWYMVAEELHADRADLSRHLQTIFRPSGERLDAVVRSGLGRGEAVTLKFIHLPVTQRDGLLPVMMVVLSPREGNVAVRFYVGLYCGDRPLERSPTGEPLFAGTGFRFEAPEGLEDEPSEHGYYHAQPIDLYGLGGAPVLCQRLVSDRTPAFPLYAKRPFELLLATLISVYGRGGAQELIEDAKVGPIPGAWPTRS